MVTTVKTNGAKKADKEAKVSTALAPATAFAHVLQTGSNARKAAINFCYAVTAYMLNVCHMQDADSKDYLSQKAAQQHVTDELQKQANVRGGMLDHYVRTGAALYTKLIGEGHKPTALGAPIVRVMADASNNEAGIEGVINAIDYMMGKNAGVESFRDLSRAMGFKSFVKKDEPATTPTQQAAKAVEGITNTIKRLEVARKEGKAGAPTEQAIAKATANVVADPLALAKAALDRYSKSDDADVEAIMDLIKFANKLIDLIEARQESDKKAEKAAAKATQTAKAKVRARTPTASTRTSV